MQTLNLTADMPRAKPEVIASLVSYLVKPEAYFITGASITVPRRTNEANDFVNRPDSYGKRRFCYGLTAS